MAINAIFLAGARNIFMIRIDGRKIFINEAKSGVHELYPNPDEYVLRIGGRPTPQEIEEYNMCKTEKELLAFCIRDCESKNCKLIKVDEK
jgi:hypothetical protein